MTIWRYEFLHWIFSLEFKQEPETIMRFGDITFPSRFPPGQFGSPEVLKNKNVDLHLNFSFATWPFNRVVIWLSKWEPLILNLNSWKIGGHMFGRRRDTTRYHQIISKIRNSLSKYICWMRVIKAIICSTFGIACLCNAVSKEC